MESELAFTTEEETVATASVAPTSEILRVVRPPRLTNRQKDMVRALACVMWADGNASSSERRIIDQLIEELGASADERTEMAAWLDEDCSTLEDVELERMCDEEKEVVLTHAMVLTLADDVLLPSEKAVLAKLTARLALPADVVERIAEDAREDGAVSLPGSSLHSVPPPPPST